MPIYDDHTPPWPKPGQMSLFDAAQSDTLKETGIALVSSHNKPWLEHARAVALDLLRVKPSITIDDVLRVAGMPPETTHSNIIGAVFHDERFIGTGEYVKSTRKTNHSRMIQKWSKAQWRV